MRGFTLIEIVIYVAILSLLAVVAANAILHINSALAEMRITRNLSSTEALAMERMIRLIRDAQIVNVAASVFDVSPGVLSLTGSEAVPLTHVLSVSGGALMLQSGAAGPIALTPPGITVSSLVFRRIQSGAVSEAVRVELILEAASPRFTSRHTVYGTAILRNSYE